MGGGEGLRAELPAQFKWESGPWGTCICMHVRDRGGEGERRENAIPDYMCFCCSVGGHVLEEARERRESRD